AGGGLPSALIHPDPMPVNTITTPDGHPVLIDWTGAGHGPRVWPLAFLLWAAGQKSAACVRAVAAGYRPHLQLEAEELDRLAAVIAARPVMFAAWGFATGRERLPGVVERLPVIGAKAASIASSVRDML
ncbi:MAG: phosphotransferase, partial [Acidimicrobiaceae bacterium]|nr:phosphotransferase [Acidimicrobiaceae bacterium]